MTRGPRVFNQCNRRADPAGNRIERGFLDVVAGDDLLDVRNAMPIARDVRMGAQSSPAACGHRFARTGDAPEVSSIGIRQRLKFPP